MTATRTYMTHCDLGIQGRLIPCLPRVLSDQRFSVEQRPLLPLGLRNAEREKLLGELAP